MRYIPNKRFDLRDLLIFIKHAGRDTALFRQQAGDKAEWGLQEQLLAHNADIASMHLWMVSADGHKNRNRPALIERPGVTNKEYKTVGGKSNARSMEEMKKLFNM